MEKNRSKETGAGRVQSDGERAATASGSTDGGGNGGRVSNGHD